MASFLYALLCLVWGLYMLIYARPSGRPAFGIFSLFAFASIVVPVALYAVAGSADILSAGIDSTYLVETSVDIAFVSLFGVLAGYFLRESLVGGSSERRRQSVLLDGRYFRLIRGMNYATFALIFLIYVINPLGPVGLIEAGFKRLPMEGFIFSFLYSLNVVASLITLVVFIECLMRGKRLPVVQMVISVGLFWTLGGRVQFVIALLPYLLAWASVGKLSAGKLAAAVGIAGSLSIFTLLLRYQTQGTQSLSFSEAAASFASQLELLSGYNIAAAYTRVYGNDPWLYFNFLLQPIPRALYPDKPEQLTLFLRYFVKGDDLGGLTVGLFGEFFVAFGWLGCFILGSIYGAFLSKLDQMYRSRYTLTSITKAYAYIMIGIATTYAMRGGIDSSVFRIAIITIVWLALAVGARFAVRKVGKRSIRRHSFAAAEVEQSEEPALKWT